MAAGASMLVYSPMHPKPIYCARMHWPGEKDIVGDISTTIEGALENLEKKLLDDATEEALRSGNV